MTNSKLWEQIDRAATEVKGWPDWKKGSPVNSSTNHPPAQESQSSPKR